MKIKIKRVLIKKYTIKLQVSVWIEYKWVIIKINLFHTFFSKNGNIYSQMGVVKKYFFNEVV